MINNRLKGFSLIELLVVIAIIGLLSTMAVVSLNNARQKARDARRMGDLRAISTAVELYKSENNNDLVPGLAIGSNHTATDWADLGSALRKYISGGLPVDPGSGAYIYCYPQTSETDKLNRYLVAGVLETSSPTQGDIDEPDAGFLASNCISSPLVVQVPPLPTTVINSVINCEDGTGQIYGDSANQNVYCLGYSMND